MPIGRYIKEEMVKVFEEKLNRSHSVILCSAGGLKAGEIGELRAKMDKEKIEFFLMKKSLASMAFQKAKINAAEFLNGDTFYAFGKDDPVSVSKILADFSRSHEALKIKGGIIDKRVVGASEINRYANLPSREVLIQQFVSGIKAPLNNLVFVLNAPLRKFILTLEAIKKGKE
jgi:large subunit ribosomal protein L10